MTLQDLVPPLELCKLIPKGEFESLADELRSLEDADIQNGKTEDEI